MTEQLTIPALSVGQEKKAKRKWFFGVQYRHNGAAAIVGPFESESEVRDAMKEGIRRHPGKTLATTYMVRESEDRPTMFDLFGHPRSRDLMQDKAFLKEITQSREEEAK